MPIAPVPAPIARISPSLGEALRTCALRAAFARDSRFDSSRRESPASALGLTCHAVAEAVARGDYDALELDAVPAALERSWDTSIERHYERLAATSMGQVPSPERWPGYTPTRRRLLRRLIAETEARRRAADTSGLPRPLVEQELAPPDIPMLGRVDRVDRSRYGTTIVDLKTGLTGANELRPSHRRQLLTYAYLWHVAHDVWPTEAAIQRLDGSRLTLRVDPVEAEAVAHELLAERNRFNSAIQGSGSIWELASPSAEACGFCDYKCLCPEFFARTSDAWGWYRRHVLGVVTAVGLVGSASRVDLNVEAGNLREDVRTVRVLGLPSDLAPRVGERMALVDAQPTRTAGEIRVAWDSQLCLWT